MKHPSYKKLQAPLPAVAGLRTTDTRFDIPLPSILDSAHSDRSELLPLPIHHQIWKWSTKSHP